MTRDVPRGLTLCEVLTTPHRKNLRRYGHFTRRRTWTDTLVRHKQMKIHLIYSAHEIWGACIGQVTYDSGQGIMKV